MPTIWKCKVLPSSYFWISVFHSYCPVLRLFQLTFSWLFTKKPFHFQTHVPARQLWAFTAKLFFRTQNYKHARLEIFKEACPLFFLYSFFVWLVPFDVFGWLIGFVCVCLLYSPKNMAESTFCDLGHVSCLLLVLHAVFTSSCKSLMVLGFFRCFISFYVLSVDSPFYQKMQISLLDQQESQHQ